MAKIQAKSGLSVAVAVLSAVLAASCSPPPKQDMNARIEESCREQYGSRGEEAVNECRIRLSIEFLQEAERGKMDSARRGAGL